MSGEAQARAAESGTLSQERLVEMYRALYGSRCAEAAVTDLARRGILPLHHSGLGHESIGVGAGFAVRPGDCVQMSHRSGVMLAHARGGFSLREAVLSRFGRAPSAFGQIDGRPRTLPLVGLVGTWVPMSVGVAMADRLRGRDSVTVTFFGDGAANEGAVHEAMNLAGARRLPIVFVAENNGMAISMTRRESSAASDLFLRAAGYGMPGTLVDGQDAIAVHKVLSAAIEHARAGEGPSMIEARIVRWEAHAVGFTDLRSEDELLEARRDDGVKRLRAAVVARSAAIEGELRRIELRCREEVEAAVDEAMRLGINDAQPEPYTEADAWRLSHAS